MKLLVKNGYILGEDGRAALMDVRIVKGKITEVGPGLKEEDCTLIDAGRNYILPGFIDMNCDICDPGYESQEDLDTVSRAAARGGYTTITCQPVTDPVVDNKTVVNYIIARSDAKALVNTYVYGSMTVGCEGAVMSNIGEMVKAGIVGLSDGGKGISDAYLMRNILLYAKMFDLPVITKCDDPALSADGVLNSGIISTITGLKGIPQEAEEAMIARNLVLAKHSGSKLHITSVSTRGSVALIRLAKSLGVSVTCETHPHYFSLTEESVRGYNAFAKVHPPLRTADDVEAVREGLADGTIDVIASGHSPKTIESKNREFDRATFGISSIETAYALSYKHLVEPGILTYKAMVDKMTKIPAAILDIGEKGRIQPGFDGDIVIIDKDQAYDINPDDFCSKAKYSPHKGATVRGVVHYTIVGGEVVYLNS